MTESIARETQLSSALEAMAQLREQGWRWEVVFWAITVNAVVFGIASLLVWVLP